MLDVFLNLFNKTSVSRVKGDVLANLLRSKTIANESTESLLQKRGAVTTDTVQFYDNSFSRLQCWNQDGITECSAAVWAIVYIAPCWVTRKIPSHVNNTCRH